MRGALLALLLLGCSNPLPADRSDYAGDWQAENVRLQISTGGRVVYHRFEGGSEKRIKAPLQSFAGDDFVVGVWFIRTTFKVSRPPHREGDSWKMTVDGMELTRR
jgi:hypothetical protein